MRIRPITARPWAIAAVLAAGLAGCDTPEQRVAAWNRAYGTCFTPAYDAAYRPAFAAAKSREYRLRLAERLAAGNFHYDGLILTIAGLLGLGVGAEGLRRITGRLRRGGHLAHARSFTRASLVALAITTTGCVEVSDPMGCAAGKRDGRVAGEAAGANLGAEAGAARADRVAAAGHVPRIYVRPFAGAVAAGLVLAVLLQAAVLGLVSSGRPMPRGVVVFLLPGMERSLAFRDWDHQRRQEADAKEARLRAEKEEERRRIREALAELDAFLGVPPDVPAPTDDDGVQPV